MGIKINLVRNLRSAMEDRRFSQYELSERSGVSVAGLSRIFNRKISPNLETLEKLARALRVRPGWLLDSPDVFLVNIREHVDRT